MWGYPGVDCWYGNDGYVDECSDYSGIFEQVKGTETDTFTVLFPIAFILIELMEVKNMSPLF